jgi:DNA-binding transcriptional LysR family regulator
MRESGVVTRLVAALEERLSTRLLQRTTRSMKLTDAGARDLDRARRILSDIAEAEALAQVDRIEPSGHFLVSAPQVFGRMHAAPLMCEFLMRHPKGVGELMLGDRPVNLVEDGVDAAIRIGTLVDSAVVSRVVGSTRRVVVASPKNRAVNRPPIGAEPFGRWVVIPKRMTRFDILPSCPRLGFQ